MANLKKYEIDAIVASVEEQINNHNKQIKDNITDKDVEKHIISNVSKYKEYIKLLKEKQSLDSKIESLEKEIKSQAKNCYKEEDRYFYLHEIETLAKSKLIQENGGINLSKEKIQNLVVMNSNLTSMQEILNSVLEALKLNS